MGIKLNSQHILIYTIDKVCIYIYCDSLPADGRVTREKGDKTKKRTENKKTIFNFSRTLKKGR